MIDSMWPVEQQMWFCY